MAPKCVEGVRETFSSTAASKQHRTQRGSAGAGGVRGRRGRRPDLEELSTSASGGDEAEELKCTTSSTRTTTESISWLCWILALLSCARRSQTASTTSSAVSASKGVIAAGRSHRPRSAFKQPAADDAVRQASPVTSDAETEEPLTAASSSDAETEEPLAVASSIAEEAAEPLLLSPPPGLPIPPGLGLGALSCGLAAPPGLLPPPSLAPPPGLAPPPPGLGALPALAGPPGLPPPPGLAEAPFDRRVFRKKLTMILRELNSHRSSSRAVQEVRDQRVPMEAQQAELVDILSRVSEIHNGSNRRVAVAFAVGLAAGTPSAFGRAEVLAAVREFTQQVVPGLLEEIHCMESILRSELLPSLRTIFATAELNAYWYF